MLKITSLKTYYKLHLLLGQPSKCISKNDISKGWVVMPADSVWQWIQRFYNLLYELGLRGRWQSSIWACNVAPKSCFHVARLKVREHCKVITLHAMFKVEALIWVSIWRALKFQRFNWRVGSNSRRHFKNIQMKYKTHIKLAHDLYGICFYIMWRIKNQPSNSTSCDDNALHLWVLVTVFRDSKMPFQSMRSNSKPI